MSTAKLERNQAEIFEQEAITAALGLGGCSSSRVQRESIPPLTNVRLQHSVMIRGAVRAPALCCTSPTGFGSSACLIRGSGLSFYLAASSQETRGHALRDDALTTRPVVRWGPFQAHSQLLYLFLYLYL